MCGDCRIARTAERMHDWPGFPAHCFLLVFHRDAAQPLAAS
jgi:hypothetical protein